MNCELAHERIVMAAYAELADEQTHELERHLAGCSECAGEREQLLGLKALADAYPVIEPDANLLARSRMRLEEALDALPPRSWFERLSQRIWNNFAGLRTAPIAACLLLVAGAGAGSFGGYRYAQNRVPVNPAERVADSESGPQTAPAASSPASSPAQAVAMQSQQPALTNAAVPVAMASISNANFSNSNFSSTNISAITRQPNSHIVDVSYNRLVPQRIEGSLDDPAMRQLLVQASQNAALASVRDKSVALLANECRAASSCRTSGIREALMVALRTDRNANVRQTALTGLEPYVAQDMQVRNAVLSALMNDSDPRIRTAAINILGPVEADTSVRQVLYAVSNTDQNPHIRTVSREVLNSVPEIQ